MNLKPETRRRWAEAAKPGSTDTRRPTTTTVMTRPILLPRHHPRQPLTSDAAGEKRETNVPRGRESRSIGDRVETAENGFLSPKMVPDLPPTKIRSSGGLGSSPGPLWGIFWRSSLAWPLIWSRCANSESYLGTLILIIWVGFYFFFFLFFLIVIQLLLFFFLNSIYFSVLCFWRQNFESFLRKIWFLCFDFW